MQRKTTALLQEVVEKVAKAGGQVQAFGEVTKRISSDNPNEESTESLKSTCEQAAVADKNASCLPGGTEGPLFEAESRQGLFTCGRVVEAAGSLEQPPLRTHKSLEGSINR